MWLAGLLAGLLVGWLFLPTPLWVCGAYSSASTPAWVQAVGSVLAILVAAAIPWWQERTKRTEEGKQLSIATLRLRSNLEVLGKAAMDRAAKLRRFRSEGHVAAEISQVLAGCYLPEAQVVTSHVENVHHFESRIQGPILSLLEEHDQYMVEHGRLHDTEDAYKQDDFGVSQTALVTRLDQISMLAFKASNAIRLVDEERKYPDLRRRNTFWRNKSRRPTHDDA